MYSLVSLTDQVFFLFLLYSFWLMPSFMLKKIVIGNFSSGPVDPMMADAIDFMVDRVRIMTLGRGHLVLGIFMSPWFLRNTCLAQCVLEVFVNHFSILTLIYPDGYYSC